MTCDYSISAENMSATLFRNARGFLLNRISLCLQQGNKIRGYRRSWVGIMMEMKNRQKRAGPEPPRHRSVWINWNYTAELYAFGKRLNEKFNDETLRTIFTLKSYIEQEEQRRKELGVPVSEASLNLKDNSALSQAGEQLMKPYIESFLRHSYPLLPEEGICCVCQYLMSDEVLSHVASNIGISDLMLCSDFPPEKSTLSATLKAVIGGIALDSDERRAELFVQDFVLVQLIGKDIFDIWEIPNPIAVLTSLLQSHGREAPEPRLIWQAGSNTIQAVYHIGMYSDKEYLGQGTGETLATAQEMAAYDVLRRIFQLTLSQDPLPLGRHGLQLTLDKGKINPNLCDWTKHKIPLINS